MDRKNFDALIHKQWAEHFNTPAETTANKGTTLLTEEKYAGEKIILLWHIGSHTYIQLDPTYLTPLQNILSTQPAHTAINIEHIKSAWETASIKSQDSGLIHYLYPQDLPALKLAQGFTLRQLTPADAPLMQALHTASPPEDVDEAYVEVDHQAVFGCFENQTLVSTASGYERNGFFDLGVLTHPQYRQKGLGKAVVSALYTWATQNQLIAQYRHNVLNTSSQQIAQSLQFKPYFRSEALFLR